MKKNSFEKAEENRLDALNKERVQTTKIRVAHAIQLTYDICSTVKYAAKHDNMDKSLEEFCENVAHASNILEAAVNEMRWACEHFGWNDGVCEQIDAAIRDFGMSIALSVRFNPDENDPMDVVYGVEDGLVKLSKALATLVRWFDDEADVSEV